MVLPLLLKSSKSKIIIDQALVTSGGGTDYDIKARSKGISKKEADVIYKKAMPPIYLGVNSGFKSALRVFEVSDNRLGLSYITIAGRDELNRPGRIRAHVLVIDKEIYELTADPLFFSKYFISKDVSGTLDNYVLDIKDFLTEVLEHYMGSKFKSVEETIKDLGRNFFVNVYSALLKDRKVLLFGGEAVDIFDVSDGRNGDKIRSVDVLRSIVLLAPPKLKSKMEYTSYSSDFAQDNVKIVFTESMPSLNVEKKSLIVDLEDGETYNKVAVSYVEDYINHIFKAIETKKFLQFLAETQTFLKSFLDIIEVVGKKEGFKTIRDLLTLAQELQIELE